MKVNHFVNEFGIHNAPPVKLIGHSYFEIEDTSLLKYRPAYIGKLIGHQRGDQFIPSVDFLQWIGHNAKHNVTVNDEGEHRFIRGKNLENEHITTHTNPATGDKAAVLNKHGDCLGYGKILSIPKKQKVILTRQYDIGDLLRREHKQRKAA